MSDVQRTASEIAQDIADAETRYPDLSARLTDVYNIFRSIGVDGNTATVITGVPAAYVKGQHDEARSSVRPGV